MLKQLILVGAGGAAGSILRFSVSLISARLVNSGFPIATFCANVTGCLLIGFFSATFPGEDAKDIRLLLTTGFCGGYTTFSAFSAENLKLLQSGQTMSAAVNILASVVAGIAAVLFGQYLAGYFTSGE